MVDSFKKIIIYVTLPASIFGAFIKIRFEASLPDRYRQRVCRVRAAVLFRQAHRPAVDQRRLEPARKLAHRHAAVARHHAKSAKVLCGEFQSVGPPSSCPWACPIGMLIWAERAHRPAKAFDLPCVLGRYLQQMFFQFSGRPCTGSQKRPPSSYRVNISWFKMCTLSPSAPVVRHNLYISVPGLEPISPVDAAVKVVFAPVPARAFPARYSMHLVDLSSEARCAARKCRRSGPQFPRR